MQDKLTFNILTIFPEMFPGPLGKSLAGKSLQQGLWNLNVFDIRQYASGVHQSVDDRPYGSGARMVLRPDILSKAINAAAAKNAERKKIYYLSPRGSRLDQKKLVEIVKEKNIMLLCGRYEGIDQRVIEHHQIEEISIGDFILSGGELAAMTLIDAAIRLIPDVLGKSGSLSEESFSPDGAFANLLEYPHYTRPQNWQNLQVPQILLSGNHQEINKWRLEQAKKITKNRRSDLWKKFLEKTE